MSKLIKFFGRECHFCHEMEPLDERLEKELGVKLERLEVWYNKNNAEMLQRVDATCGGVPFYLNRETGKTLCGMVDYGTLKSWALGKVVKQSQHNHDHDEHDHEHHHH